VKRQVYKLSVVMSLLNNVWLTQDSANAPSGWVRFFSEVGDNVPMMVNFVCQFGESMVSWSNTSVDVVMK
jgi:hypothetical protein